MNELEKRSLLDYNAIRPYIICSILLDHILSTTVKVLDYNYYNYDDDGLSFVNNRIGGIIVGQQSMRS